jgi:hypothetical protein
MVLPYTGGGGGAYEKIHRIGKQQWTQTAFITQKWKHIELDAGN